MTPAGSASGIIVFDGDASLVSITDKTVTGWASPQVDPNNGNNCIVFVDSNGGTVTGNTISAFDYGLAEINQFGGHLTTLAFGKHLCRQLSGQRPTRA